MKNHFKTFSLLAGIVLIVFLVWQFPDEALEPGVGRWMTEYSDRSVPEGNGYIYALGIGAAPDDDPWLIGAARARELATLSKNDELSQEAFDATRSGGLPELDEAWHCNPAGEDCVVEWLANIDAAKAVLANHFVLRERYQRLLDIERYTPPDPWPAVVADPHFEADHRAAVALVRLNAVALAADGAGREAVDTLLEDIELNRARLNGMDSLIGRLSLLAIIANDLRLVAGLVAHGLVTAQQLPSGHAALMPLTISERDMLACMRHEFAFSRAALGRVEKASTETDELRLPSWAMQFLLKPNATANAQWRNLSRTVELSRLAPAELVAAPDSVARAGRLAKLRNPLGVIIVEIAAPAWGHYQWRNAEVELLLQLVRLRARLRDVEAAGAALDAMQHTPDHASPFDAALPYADVAGGVLCYPMPKKSRAEPVCIVLKADQLIIPAGPISVP